MPWQVVTLRMWRQEKGDLGWFKGRSSSAWAAVDTAHGWGTNSEQSSALLMGAKQPLLSNSCVVKSLRIFEVEPRVSEGCLETWKAEQVWFTEPVPCRPSASLGKGLATGYRSDLGMESKTQPIWRSPVSEPTSAWRHPPLPGAPLGLASCWWPSCSSSPVGSPCCHWWQSLHCLLKASLVL